MLQATRAAIERLATDEAVTQRLTMVPTVVEITVSDPGEAVREGPGSARTGAMSSRLTLLLDRNPVATHTGDPPAAPEVRVDLSASQLHRFWTGELQLAIAIMRGDVHYDGPVRKLLRVVPILRRAAPAYLELLDEAPGGDSPGVGP